MTLFYSSMAILGLTGTLALPSGTQQAGAPIARPAEEIKIPDGEVSLGRVRLPAPVMADVSGSSVAHTPCG